VRVLCVQLGQWSEGDMVCLVVSLSYALRDTSGGGGWGKRMGGGDTTAWYKCANSWSEQFEPGTGPQPHHHSRSAPPSTIHP
jgi:hypothetical protein